MVDNQACVEMASMCADRLLQLTQFTNLPQATKQLANDLEFVNRDQAPHTRQDTLNLTDVRTGSQQYLKLVKKSSTPTVREQFEARRKFRQVPRLPFPSFEIASFFRGFVLKHSKTRTGTPCSTLML